MTSRVACLFPTFPMRHREFRADELRAYPDVLNSLAERASALVTITPRTFDHPPAATPPDTLEDTLQAHYACYIESVAMGEWLRPHYPQCDYVAAYSMGLFAALCHSGAVSFEDGLRLMHGICVNTHDLVAAGRYAMGVVVGLTWDGVQNVLAAECPRVEITDRYSPQIAIVSGRRDDVAGALDACVTHGAVETKLIPVTAPFHSSALAAMGGITLELLRTVSINVPRCAIVSSITQEVLTDPDDIRIEVADNISHAMNWYGTMRKLLDLNANLFLECGATMSLTNMARRDLPGTYTIHDVRDFACLSAAAQ